MHVLCAPDKFAGGATAAEVAAAMAAGVADAGHGATCLPVADGGEGSFAVLAPRQVVAVSCAGPLRQARQGRIGELPDGRGFVESADACGIAGLGRKDPLAAGTLGVGQLLLAALQRHEQVVVGLGGSATVDLGAGLACALGVRLLDAEDRVLDPVAGALRRVARVVLPDLAPLRGRIVAWCDVSAPLLGEGITAASFLAQKGVDDPEPVLAGWRRLLHALAEAGLPVDPTAPGSGAAGGLGLMLAALLDAPLLPGADAVLDAVGFDTALARADLVLTGEGRFDRQSLAGKVPGRVLARAAAAGVPAVVLAGAVQPGAVLPGQGAEGPVIAVSDPALPLAEQLAGTLPAVRAAARRVVDQSLSTRQ